ncbi:hypothetical protein L227DRAFT_176559 [Lentinus tigrinus ALCF2SS1-6]|uniref:Uncharacterized protein n=2 Tax=Lentinus tigrinus TaxID=5365 RepID=A0A5C2S5A9_9APHY|nr:hypothetical protein L227DRAFT_176559 [Lentinus tigrinus ALCF2SS1-6]
MLFSLATLALAFVGAVQAVPVTDTLTPTVDSVSVDAATVLDLSLGSVSPKGNVTVGKDGVHVDAASATYPATLFLCRSSSCGSCTGYDLSIQRHNTCLTGGFNFYSMYISQPSNSGLPYAVYTGPSGCGSFAQVPAVNTCYRTNYVGWDFELIP